MSKTLWYLIDGADEKEYPKITLEDVVNLLTGVQAERRKSWYVWKSGFSDWKCVADVPEIVGALEPPEFRGQKMPSAPLKSMSRNEERRKHPRSEAKMRIVLLNESVSFRAFSKNISLGGILLDHPVPETFHDKISQALIKNPEKEQNMAIAARIIVDGKTPHRMAFVDPEAELLKTLEQWIVIAAKKTSSKKRVA